MVDDGREGVAAIESLELGTPKGEIEKYSLMEEEMRQSEQIIIATQEKKNELEQYLYNKKQLCEEPQYSSYLNAEVSVMFFFGIALFLLFVFISLNTHCLTFFF